MNSRPADRPFPFPDPVEGYEYDVVVYGGTSSGVVAAVQAARMGCDVLLVAAETHLGGMTSSGLGLTDMGATDTIGGLARAFYHRVWQHYRAPAAWRYGSRDEYLATHPTHWGVTGPNVDRRQAQFMFEPHVAEAVFNAMLLESGAHVALRERLDLAGGVRRDGRRIAAIRCEGGREYPGRTFIDATYEGDLLARAGVRHVVGREPNQQYGETFNGVRPNRAIPIDPYRTLGDPTSGLLPDVEPRPPGADGDGDGDARVQAYNFRLCLTDRPDNRVEIGPPPGYDAARYELHARYYHTFGSDAAPGRHRYAFFGLFGDDRDGVVLFSRMPNRKTDSNNTGFASTDLVGQSRAWVDGDYATRGHLWTVHKHYIQGLLYFAKTDRRFPAAVRDALSEWGLARDEFADNDHWPYQLYVREARRMVGDYVVTEHDTTRARVADDAVAMGSYPADSHHVTYYVDDDGRLWHEGGFWDDRTRPFPIPYRAIRPARGQCENLLVSGCVSASHVAYASVRMEPVFMMLGQAAATAAALAADRGQAVQDLPYDVLRRRLLADGAILEWQG